MLPIGIPGRTAWPSRCANPARIERTLFILDWMQSVELRRRVDTGLNKATLAIHSHEPFFSTALAKSITPVSR